MVVLRKAIIPIGVCFCTLMVTVFLNGCHAKRHLLSSSVVMEQVEGEVAYLRDSTWHHYKYETVRDFDPVSGVLVREVEQGEGERSAVFVYLRDTIYIERRDTIEVREGNAAPLGTGVLEAKRAETSRAWAGAVPYLFWAFVLLCVVGYVILSHTKRSL